MRLTVTSQAHPYLQNRLVRYIKTQEDQVFRDITRVAIYEFDEAVRLYDIVTRLEWLTEGSEVSGDIIINVYFEYKRTEVVLSDVTQGPNIEYPTESSNYGSYLLRSYTYSPGTTNLEVMQGAFLEGSLAPSAVHEHLPPSLPPNSRIVFQIKDEREGGTGATLVNDVVRATIGVVVSAGGML